MIGRGDAEERGDDKVRGEGGSLVEQFPDSVQKGFGGASSEQGETGRFQDQTLRASGTAMIEGSNGGEVRVPLTSPKSPNSCRRSL